MSRQAMKIAVLAMARQGNLRGGARIFHDRQRFARVDRRAVAEQAEEDQDDRSVDRVDDPPRPRRELVV